ncbi:hypothetical protein MSPP1_000255 [Malassezia sp. CBS 17886]|nr:hypothetical protein MSPP1_000255 [Malassezia sp. CBS 17886]
MADELLHTATLSSPDDRPHNAEVDALTQKLEDKVAGAVGGLSSWWSGVSKQSQEAVQAARSAIEEQGGVVQAARHELLRLDSSMDDASRRAREQSRGAAEPVEAGYVDELAEENTRETADETPCGPAAHVHGAPGAARPERGAQEHAAAQGAASENAAQGGPVAVPTGIWDTLQRLAHHPQVEHLQQQFGAVVHPTSQTDGEASKRSLRETLYDVEQAAVQYLHNGEALAREVGKDMQDLLHDIVQVVPDESGGSASGKGKYRELNAPGGKPALSAPCGGERDAADAPREEWDADRSAGDGAETAGAEAGEKTPPAMRAPRPAMDAPPPQPALVQDEFAWDDDDEPEDALQPSATASTQHAPATSVVPPHPTPPEPRAQDDDDSDWE